MRSSAVSIVALEKRLASITMSAEERRKSENEGKLYNKETVKELQEMAPFIDW